MNDEQIVWRTQKIERDPISMLGSSWFLSPLCVLIGQSLSTCKALRSAETEIQCVVLIFAMKKWINDTLGDQWEP